jgi:glycosyltransferase involved in cell wall biosynthesis
MEKLISIVTPCYNEEANVAELNKAVVELFAKLPQYRFEHIFIDNCSQDRTVPILREMAKNDQRVKVIINSRNFGHIRSPYHGLISAYGDAVVFLFADFQEPPALIEKFLEKWEEGFKVVAGVKVQSDESSLFFMLRKWYYKLVSRLADVQMINNFTGFGLFDKKVIEILREIQDPYPYFRGLVCELGFERATVEYHQAARKRGITKNNFYTLYDIAMLGIVTNSKVPLRIATIAGFILSGFSLLVAIVYLIVKLLFWNNLPFGQAPLLIGVFFFASVQMFFIGILGEYIGSVQTQVLNRPRVIEKERINF